MLNRVASAFRVLLGLGLLAWVLSRTGVSTLAPVLSRPLVLAVLIGLTAAGAAVEAERLRLLFRAAGLRLTRQGAYRVVPVGTFFNFTIPGGTGGDVVKLYYLAQDNRNRGLEVATVLLVDRAIALFSVLLFVAVMIGLNREAVLATPLLRGLALLVFAGLAVLGTLTLLAWSTRLRTTRFYRWAMARIPFHRQVQRMADAVHEFGDRKRAVAAATCISLVGHVAGAAMYVVVASAVIPDAPWTIVAFLSMMGMVANAIPLTPGGLGVGEAAFDHLFSTLGYNGGAALLILWRIALLPIASLGAILYITGQARHSRTPLHDPPPSDGSIAPGH